MPLQYVGVPASILFRPDWTHAVLHGLAPDSDYLNPTTWTGATGYSVGQGIAPEWTVGVGEGAGGTGNGDGNSSAPVRYSVAVQVLFSSAGSMPAAVTELASAWRGWNAYEVDELEVMGVKDAFDVFATGRRHTSMWIDGYGYKLQAPGRTFGSGDYISLHAQSMSAYLEYLMFVRSGDELWRNRSFVQMNTVLGGQNRNLSSVHHGAIHSSFRLDKMQYTSNDRGHSPGLKPDLVAMMARYMLQLWHAVRAHEGDAPHAWYEGGLAAARWLARQQNAQDGGLPNRISLRPIDNWNDRGTPSASVVSGRALSGLPVILNVTQDAKVNPVDALWGNCCGNGELCLPKPLTRMPNQIQRINAMFQPST